MHQDGADSISDNFVSKNIKSLQNNLKRELDLGPRSWVMLLDAHL